jgi:hypothetical protein
MGQSGMAVGLPRARGTATGGEGRAAHAMSGLLPCTDGRVGSGPDHPYQRTVALADWIAAPLPGKN